MTYRLPVWLLYAAALVAPLWAVESNGWPFAVWQVDAADATESWQAVGPLFFAEKKTGLREASGFRPFSACTQEGDKKSAYFLYPLLQWHQQGTDRQFSLFNLINHSRDHRAAGGGPTGGLDVWPFYFSRDTGAADTSYRAFFPISGTLKYRFGQEALTWHGFPFFAQAEKRGRQTTYAPWPFVRLIDGAGHKGFELWPLWGRRGRTNDYREQFCLWPIFYRQERRLAEPQPDTRIGVLPFYTREQGPGYRSETFLWPFFGYTQRNAPQAYDEKRWLWPFLVQGRGKGHHVNRWAPFFTHSVVRGYDKTWVLWPLFREAQWQEQGVAQHRFQFLYFLYWSQEQRSLANPGAAHARKTHVWPLYSAWDNGAGRRQFQFLSPFEPLFPSKEAVHHLYSPLFALYRFDQRSPQDVRWSLLWNGITWRHRDAAREFHLGPLLSVQTTATEQRVALGRGLIGMTRQPGDRVWRAFLFDFSRKNNNKESLAPSP
ncbi:MAG: hypothetical protein PHQ04_03130 [Opitutaceae bacterium]|nr:hypothetical protein [Opitutaceae bacterium]